MKITSFFIITYIIMFPLLCYSQWRAEDVSVYTRLNKQYDMAITTATQDAITILRRTSVGQDEAGYASSKENPADKDAALKTFLQTLSVSFQTNDTNTIDLISRYVPAFAVLENDGLSLSVFQHSSDKNGNDILKRQWMPKVPFSYTDKEGNIINFTIDQDIEIYVKSLDEWYEGTREEVMDLIKEEVHYEDPDTSKITLLDKVSESLLKRLKEGLSDDLYKRLTDSLRSISTIDELDEELQDEISEIDYNLLSDLIVALTPKDIEDPENEATLPPVFEEPESDADTLRARLTLQTKAELRAALPEELFNELIEMLGKYKSEFDIEPAIVDRVQAKVSDDLFIRFLTDIATPTEGQLSESVCEKPTEDKSEEKEDSSAITKASNPIKDNPVYKILGNLTDKENAAPTETNGMDAVVGTQTDEDTETEAETGIEVTPPDEDTPANGNSTEDTDMSDTENPEVGDNTPTDDNTKDDNNTSSDDNTTDDNNTGDENPSDEEIDVSPPPTEDEDPYLPDVKEDDEVEDDGHYECKDDTSNEELTKPDEPVKDKEPVAEETPAIFILNNKDYFERVRKKVIVSVMQDQFAYYINQHNTYTRQLGITYKFSLPLISDDDWYNSVDDDGIFAFVQGVQFSRGDYTYSSHAFAGARLLKKDKIYGATVEHKKVYYSELCKFKYDATEIFNSKKEAAKNGYREVSCLNKQ